MAAASIYESNPPICAVQIVDIDDIRAYAAE
jgi:hypothetical protein